MRDSFTEIQTKAIKAARVYLDYNQYKILDVCQIHDYSTRNLDPYITAVKDGKLYLFWIGVKEDDFPKEPTRRILERVSTEVMSDPNSEYHKCFDNELKEIGMMSHRIGTLCFNVINGDRALLRCHIWD